MPFVITPPTLQELRRSLSDPELFSSLDKHFAMFIGRLAKIHAPEAALAAALVSRSTGEGNICLDLAEYAGKPLDLNSLGTDTGAPVCPPLEKWTAKLRRSGVVSEGEGGTPLVLDDNSKLYLRRYWQYQHAVIRFIRQRSNAVHENLNYSILGKDLKKLFQPLPAGEIDWQQIAAIAAVTRSFCVISGGPGTGKTSTVAKILALLHGQHNDARPLRILLGAPTGKAASRLQQAIAASGLLQTGPEPLQASTVHRMLGSIPNSPYFRHNAENPLAADIIVIDEASMVDLPLLAKLVQAVPASARLLLLGDRHQLASVQPGSALGDMCCPEAMASFSNEFCQLVSKLTAHSITPAPPRGKKTSFSLQDSFIELLQSYRFAANSGIARLSTAINEGDGNGALSLLLEGEDGSIVWSETPAPAELGKKLQKSPGISQFTRMQQIPEPDSCFNQLDSFRILCGLRSGPFGMERINTLLEQQLSQQVQGDLNNHAAGHFRGDKNAQPFRPVMVTRNDYTLQLFNGDVGILLPDPENREALRVFFRDEAGRLRDVAPALLPGYETVFAMTVHKSQGSEFNRVLLILPDKDSPLLTRELLYTAITRARETVEIWGRMEIFASAVQRRIKRTSGLAEALWGRDI
jgi:exodeoxyribonuclease V alpha subunit